MLEIIELFAGIGSQTQSLANIGVEHEVVAISEIDKYAVQSYEAVHGKANNLGDITKIEQVPQADLWTYSFPCQDISVAGKGAGIKTGTRSGLLFEVERLLRVATANDTLPKYLLLENVKNLIGKKFRADFNSWLSFLSEHGYTNYWQVLNAKNYGIPQHRERVFCVSIRGEHRTFVFPEKQELTLRLRDMIDEVVDEKFYLKESTIKSIMKSNFQQRRKSLRPIDGLANTLCARDWREPQCVQVGKLMGEQWEKMQDISRRVYEPDGLSPTVHCCGGGNTEVKIITEGNIEPSGHSTAQIVNVDGLAIMENHDTDVRIVALRGRNPVNPSDRTAGAMMVQRLEQNFNGTTNTITTVQKDNLVMENAYVSRRYGEFIEDKGYLPEMFVAYNKTEVEDVAPTLTVQCSLFSGSSAVLKMEVEDVKILALNNWNQKDCDEMATRERIEKDVSHAICVGDKQAVLTQNVRIRKLTPRECLRLMGWNDDQIDKIQASGVSNTQQYRQAGNGIVIQVLEKIFKTLFSGETK